MKQRPTQAEKGKRFEELHRGPRAFVIPNPWDAGTARLLEWVGFDALATTSAGLAFALGRTDGTGALTRDATLANVKAIVDATDLPVAGDLENGYGESPDVVRETVRLAGEVGGLVGGSIEDATGDPSRPIYEFPLAVDRIAAAAEAAHALPFPFVLVGRAENYLYGRRDLDDTIRRLQAFEAAGADALYAPGITNGWEIRVMCAAVHKPVNVVMGLTGAAFSVDELEAMGVRRISVGSALSRAALATVVTAAREMKNQGTFTFAKDAIPYKDVNYVMRDRAPSTPS